MNDEQLKQAVIETQTLCQHNAKQIEGLTAAVGRIVDKLEARSGVNWTAIGLIVPVIGGAWVLINTQITAVKDIVKSVEIRTQRLENVDDSEKEHKSKMWDNYVFDRLSRNE